MSSRFFNFFSKMITRHGEVTMCVNARVSKLIVLFHRLPTCNALCDKPFGCNAFASNSFVYSALYLGGNMIEELKWV